MSVNTRKRKINFDYFQVFCHEIDKERNSANEKYYDITAILEKASKLEPKETMRPYRADKARIQVVKKDPKKGIWELQLLRLRETNPPGIATDDGDYTIFELEDGKYLGESTTVLYDSSKCILVMQRSRDGFTPTGLQEYLNAITKRSNDLIFFKPILCGVDINKIKKDKIYRKIFLNLSAKDMTDKICNSNPLTKFLMEVLKFQSNNIKIELSIGHGKKSETLDEVLSYDLIRELYNKKFTNKLEVGYKDNKDSNVEYIDLIDDRRVDEVIVTLQRNHKLIHEIIYPEIRKKYLKRKDANSIF